MALQGLDIEAVTALGNEIKQLATEIQNRVNALKGKVASVPWVGPDKAAFVNAWGQHESTMTALVNALTQAGDTAIRNANEQQQASAR